MAIETRCGTGVPSVSGSRDLTVCRDWSCISSPPGCWTPGLGLLSLADDGLTVMGASVHYADSLVLSPVRFFSRWFHEGGFDP
jgi:hypothetical protein